MESDDSKRAKRVKYAAAEVSTLLSDRLDKLYIFEFDDQSFRGLLIAVSISLASAENYQMVLAVSSDVVIEGECFILDSKDRRVTANGKTERNSYGTNRIILEGGVKCRELNGA